MLPKSGFELPPKKKEPNLFCSGVFQSLLRKLPKSQKTLLEQLGLDMAMKTRKEPHLRVWFGG